MSQDHPSPPEHPEVQDHPSPPEPPDLGEVPTPVDSGSASSAGGRDTPAAPEPPAPEPPAVAPELQPVPGPVAPQTSPSVAANPKGANANDSGEVAGDRSGSLELAFDRDGRAYRAGEIVIIGAASDLETIARLRLPIIEHRPLTGLGGMLFRIAVPLSVDPQAVRAQLASAIPGAATDLNHVYRLAAGAGSSARATQASVPHRVGAGIVGIIDTGVDARATELAAAVIETRRFAPGPAPSAAHGAAVAYIAAQHGAKVLDADVFTRDRADSEAASVDAMARAVDWLAGQGVAVINMSLEGPPNQALAEVVRRAQAKGCIVVAAVGNGGPAAPPAYPAAFPAVVAVTAVDGRRQAYIYANRGDYVMFSAFGVDVKAPPGVSRTSLSGTSYASPVVAALIARRMPRQDAHAAAEALAALKSQAIDLGPPGRDPVFGFGLVGDM